MSAAKTCLSVNVNKLATLRNSRGKNNPDVVKTALQIVTFGAEGITVHPRPDGRHIRRQDVVDLKRSLTVELNIEGYPTDDFLELVEEVRPAQVTLVPDPPHVLTSNAGWRVAQNFTTLGPAIERIHKCGARVSLFIDPKTVETADWESLVKLRADRVELYTEAYAEAYPTPQKAQILRQYREAGLEAIHRGLQVNAGHDLNLENLTEFCRALPFLSEVSIGHALICDALQFGLDRTVRLYLDAIGAAVLTKS